MSTVQVTPRKRKVGITEHGLMTPPSSGRTRAKGKAPTPNPPLAPFPTPPSSRTRKAQLSEPSQFEEDSDAEFASAQTVSKSRPLPDHLQTLLALHHAFNLALSLHIATKPPILPPHPPSTVRLQLPCLTNYLAIRETVERTARKRFGLQALARLAWLWQWDGETSPEDDTPGGGEDDNPFLVKSPSAPASRTSEADESISAMSYLITPTKTLDGSGKRMATYGLGIELDLKPGETRQMLHNGAEGGLGNKGQGGGMGAVGRWNNHGEARMEKMREKLEKWVDLHGGFEVEEPVQAGLHTTLYPTPTSSHSSESSGHRSSIPPIPLLQLPALGVTSNLLAKAAADRSPSASTASPARSRITDQMAARDSPTKIRGPAAALASAANIDESDSGGGTASGSGGLLAGPADIQADTPKSGKMTLEERRKSMADRIKGRNKTTLGQSVHGDYKINGAGLSGSALQERLQHRATLSRLPSVAEAVWMMFAPPLSSSSSSSPAGISSMPSPPPRPRRKAIRMDECVDTIVKSSKTPISHAEAEKSINMLTDKFPGFLLKKVVSKVEYIHMPPGAMGVPVPVPVPAPSSPLVSAARSSRASTPPPFAKAGGGGPPASPSPSPRAGRELAGPASPGRVRKFGGLREVREKIRRELELAD